MTTLRQAEQSVIDAALTVDTVRMLVTLLDNPAASMTSALEHLHSAISVLLDGFGESDSAFAVDWEIGCAYAAGRRSVIESEEMAVLRRCADVALDEEWNWPKSSTDDAAIRAALEVLKS